MKSKIKKLTSHEEVLCADSYDRGFYNGTQEGYAKGKKETEEKLNLHCRRQDALLKAVEVQNAAMENLTRLILAIRDTGV
jgi:flagellar biosynthesis/type III secretory pathway protein FliH